MVLTHSHRIPRVLWYSGYPPSKINFAYEAITPFRPAFQPCSTIDFSNSAGPNPFKEIFKGLGSFAFAHHYLRNRLFTFFSSGYLDVSVPRVPFIYIHAVILPHYRKWVAPFGNLRVKAYLQLTVAYRSLSRPSSALGAKASTLCPY